MDHAGHTVNNSAQPDGPCWTHSKEFSMAGRGILEGNWRRGFWKGISGAEDSEHIHKMRSPAHRNPRRSETWGISTGRYMKGYPTSFSSWAFLRWVLGGTPAACPIVIVQYLWTMDGSNNRRKIIGDSYTGGGVVLLVAADVRSCVCTTFCDYMGSDGFWWILMDSDGFW